MINKLTPQCDQVVFLQSLVFFPEEMPIEHETEDAAFVIPLSDIRSYFSDRIQSRKNK